MTERQRHIDDEPEPNQASAKERAEGSRETVQGNAQPSAGITNRPLEREEAEQEQVPPRGQRKDGSSHA